MQLACNMSDISDFVQEIVPAYRCVHTPDKFPGACVHGSWGGQSWSFIAGEEGEMPNGYGRLINPDPGRSARSLARSPQSNGKPCYTLIVVDRKIQMF